MTLFTIRLKAMNAVTDDQINGLLSGMQYLHTQDELRQILTDGYPSNVVEHIREEFVPEISNLLTSLGLEHEVMPE